MNFSRWLLMIVVIVVDALNGGAGHEDCRETRCGPREPAIRYPFRLKGRQPIPCAFRGFDVSCTDHNQTILELPSSSAKFRVYEINYRSHAIRGRAYDGCLPRELFYSNGSYPLEFVGPATLFSCPPSTVRDEFCSNYDHCLTRLSPCHGNNSGNHLYAVTGYYCSFDEMPLVSCIKVHDYTSDPAYTLKIGEPMDIYDEPMDIYEGIGEFLLHWSIPSCEHCKGRNLRRTNLKILGICALCLVLIATGTTIYHVYTSNKMEKENQLRIERFLDDYRAMKPSRYSYADIKRITNQFKEKLGQGAYGTVFKGKLSSELLVAVKILNNSNENGVLSR